MIDGNEVGLQGYYTKDSVVSIELVDTHTQYMIRRRAWIAGGIIALIIGILVYVLYQTSRGEFGPAFASAFATSALVLVTAISAILTIFLLIGQSRERKQNIKPVFKPVVKSYTLSDAGIAIKNIGDGPAVDMEVTIEGHETGRDNTVTRPNLAEGSIFSIPKPLEDESFDPGDLDDLEKLSIRIKCEDIMGNEYTSSHSIGGKNWSRDGALSGMMEDDDVSDKLSDIDSTLGDIESRLR